jgi:hypothetical protein
MPVALHFAEGFQARCAPQSVRRRDRLPAHSGTAARRLEGRTADEQVVRAGNDFLMTIGERP